jgi:hypothetical protein
MSGPSKIKENPLITEINGRLQDAYNELSQKKVKVRQAEHENGCADGGGNT